jgi:acyl-CoA thioester hydrolase
MGTVMANPIQDAGTPTPRLYGWQGQVQIHDTDCYDVVWHGAYLRWLESARAAIFTPAGIVIGGPGTAQWVFPIVEQHLTYKQSPRAGDAVAVHTTFAPEKNRLVFTQRVLAADNDILYMQGITHCVVLEASTKQLLRRLPAVITGLAFDT